MKKRVSVCESFNWAFAYCPSEGLIRIFVCWLCFVFFLLCHIVSVKKPGCSLTGFLNNVSKDPHGPPGLEDPMKIRECGDVLPVSLFWPAKAFFRWREGPFQVWSQTWLCPDCVTGCVQIVVLGTCSYQLGFGWRKKNSYHEYTQLPHDSKMEADMHN